MPQIEKALAIILGSGFIAWVVGLRIYGVYSGIKESQRSDKAEPSQLQTLFSEPERDSRTIPSDVETTLFSSQDRN
jgi:hypothetical protein